MRTLVCVCVRKHKDRKTGRTYLLPIPSSASCPWMLAPDRIKNESNSNISCEKICGQQGPERRLRSAARQGEKNKGGGMFLCQVSYSFRTEHRSFWMLCECEANGCWRVIIFYGGLWKLKILCIKLFSFLFVRWRIFFHSSLRSAGCGGKKVGSYNDGNCR